MSNDTQPVRFLATLAAVIFGGVLLLCIAVQVFSTTAIEKQAPLRISFLNNGPALKDTLALLRSNGIPADALAVFNQAVNDYNQGPLEIDLSRFSRPSNGFYHFKSMSHLVSALPHKLCDTQHPCNINCFDTAFILLSQSIHLGVGIDQPLTPFLVPHSSTNGGFRIVQATNARSAFALLYAGWYRDSTRKYFPKIVNDSRACFSACLFRMYALPTSLPEGDLGNAVMGILRSNWKTNNMKFPSEVELVMCHDVDLPHRVFATSHVALLLRVGKGYVYLEKAGVQGPFVRIDLEDKADVLKWLARTFTGAEAKHLGYTHNFVTFGEKSIETLKADQ